jgi:hypothetical protein
MKRLMVIGVALLLAAVAAACGGSVRAVVGSTKKHEVARSKRQDA